MDVCVSVYLYFCRCLLSFVSISLSRISQAVSFAASFSYLFLSLFHIPCLSLSLLVSIHIPCLSLSLLVSNYIPCLSLSPQVSCSKRRDLKAGIKEQFDVHKQIATEQLKKVSELLQKAGGPERMGPKDRAQVARAYAERIRQQQEAKNQQEQQQQQLLLQQVHQHQQLALQRQQQLMLQQQLLQQQRPGAPVTVAAAEEEEQQEPQEEDEKETHSTKEEAPPKPRPVVKLVLSGGAPRYPPGVVPWALTVGALLLLLLL